MLMVTLGGIFSTQVGKATGNTLYDNEIHSVSTYATIQGDTYWSDFDEPSDGAWDTRSDGIVDAPSDTSGDGTQDGWFLQPDEQPVANFTYILPNPRRPPLVFFTDTSYDPEGMIVSWLWDFDDGYASSLQNPVHFYVVDGTYNASLTVTDNGGLTNTIMKTVIVYTPPNNPPATPLRSYGISFGITTIPHYYTTRATDPDGNLLFYRWDWGDGTMSGWFGPHGSGLIVGARHVWASGGTYQVRVKVRDQYGAESEWSAPLNVRLLSVAVGQSGP